MNRRDIIYGKAWGWLGIVFVSAIILIGHCSCTQRVIEVRTVYITAPQDTGTKFCPRHGCEFIFLYTKKPGE